MMQTASILAVSGAVVALLVAFDLLLRRVGLGSFPVYEPSPSGFYRVRPGQAGRFRRTTWRYDANGMRNDEIPPSFADTTLLIGDSIVDGGIRIDQHETLAKVAAGLSGERFYTVACHGWALGNSLPALRALPGWRAAKRLVFVVNTGDLDVPVELGDEFNHPTRRPFWLMLWLARRHVYRHFVTRRHAKAQAAGSLPARLAPAMRANNLAAFRQLVADYPGSVVLVRYAMLGEDARTEGYFEQLASLDPRIRILEAADAPGWSDDCYIDHIHPNTRGIQILARHLCEGLS
jgi:hypothetical protein